jgi:hypothetical protein
LGEGDLMGAGQIQAEGFCTLDELAQVCVATKQVIHELSTKGLLSANQLATGFGMTVRKRRHRVVNDLQHRRGRGPHCISVAFSNDRRQFSPHASSCGQIEVDSAACGHSGLRRATALETHRVELGPPGEATEGGGVGENR